MSPATLSGGVGLAEIGCWFGARAWGVSRRPTRLYRRPSEQGFGAGTPGDRGSVESLCVRNRVSCRLVEYSTCHLGPGVALGADLSEDSVAAHEIGCEERGRPSGGVCLDACHGDTRAPRSRLTADASFELGMRPHPGGEFLGDTFLFIVELSGTRAEGREGTEFGSGAKGFTAVDELAGFGELGNAEGGEKFGHLAVLLDGVVLVNSGHPHLRNVGGSEDGRPHRGIGAGRSDEAEIARSPGSDEPFGVAGWIGSNHQVVLDEKGVVACFAYRDGRPGELTKGGVDHDAMVGGGVRSRRALEQ